MIETYRYDLLNKVSLLFFTLIPIALLTGSFLPDLFLSFIVLIFIYKSIRFKLKKYYFNNYFYFFAIFYIYLVLNSFLSVDSALSFKSSIFYFRFFIFGLAIWYLLDRNKNTPKYFTYSLLFSIVLSIVDGYFQFFFNISLFGIENLNSSRLNLVFNDKLILGGYLSRLFPLALALIIFYMNNSKKYYYLIVLLLILIDILIYISGERTALGLMILSNIFILTFMKNLKLLRLGSLLLSLIIIYFITINYPNIKERNVDHTINQFNFVSDNDKLSITLLSPEHESLFFTSWNIFIDKPIMGSGVNTFRVVCNNEIYAHNLISCSTHPHNSYLQIMAETGGLGVIFLLLIILYFSKIIFVHACGSLNKNFKKLNDYQICLIACFFLSLWPFLPTQNLFNNWINVIYFLPVGFFLKSLEEINSN